MKIVWLLYQQEDLSANRDYARLMRENGLKRDMKIETVLTRDLTLLLDENGTPSCLRKGRKERPDAVIARMREPLYSRHFERMGVPVFNGSEVCRICNDKRQTLQFLSGLPMPRTTFLTPFTPMPQDGPVIVKPACSHGGDRVELVETQFQWNDALEALQGEPALMQSVTRRPGRDLRVYVLFGQIVAGVMRTAKSGVVSNYKRGGNVALHDLSREERQLAEEVIARFDAVLCRGRSALRGLRPRRRRGGGRGGKPDAVPRQRSGCGGAVSGRNPPQNLAERANAWYNEPVLPFLNLYHGG